MKEGSAMLKHFKMLSVGPEGISWAELICTCEVDMREVSWRPVKSDEETLTGAPRWSRMLTFRSRSIPDTGRGEDVFAVEPDDGMYKQTKPHIFNIKVSQHGGQIKEL